jgi:hypothetical protein
MESETIASLLLLLAMLAAGLVTMIAAYMRGPKGPPIIWFIGGAFLPLIALPAALIKLNPKRKAGRVVLKLTELARMRARQCTELAKKVALKCFLLVRGLKSPLTLLKMWRAGN